MFTVATLIGSAVAANTKLVAGPFNSTAYSKLIDCVRNVSSKYHIAIDNGVVVIMPPEGESIDIDGADSALLDCLHSVSAVLNAAIDSHRDCAAGGAPSQTLEHAHAQWAESNGAEGLRPHTHPHGGYGQVTGYNASEGHAMSARQVVSSYYYAYGSDFKDCSSADSQATVYNECISHSNPYQSISFGNVDRYNNIRVDMWPHHQCAVDYQVKNTRTIIVAPAADSVCQRRTTYSYLARVIPRSCFGTCV